MIFRMLVLVMCISAIGSIEAQEDISVEQAWARDTPPGASNGAVYFIVENRGQLVDQLTGLSSNASERAEIHTHIDTDGIMQMRQVDVVEVPAGGSTVFEPGGDHIMLINLSQGLKEGGVVSLDLEFAQAGLIRVNIPVHREAPQ